MIYKAKHREQKKKRLPWWVFVVAALVLAGGLGLFLWLTHSAQLQAAFPFSASGTGGAAGEGLVPPQNFSIDQRAVVAIDPGHGGNDPGALDQEETVTEARVNAQVAALVLEKLARHPEEILPVNTNPDNMNLSVAARAKAAMDQQADLLVSLHLNADSSSASHGFQVYPPPPGWAYHEESLAFAQGLANLVNEGTGLEVLGHSGVFYAFYEPLAGGRYRKDIIDAGWYAYQAPRKSETFGVIERCGCPAVLVEQWFITSPQDMALMHSAQGMEAMADIVYREICRFVGVDAVD